MVRNILLIRHAEAHFESETNSDFDRKLSHNGENQGIMLGQYIKDLPFKVDAVYTSPSKRTLQTVKHFIQPLEPKPRIMDAEELYEATLNVLKAALARFDNEFKNIAVVAHNPSVAGLFTHLSSEIRDYTPGTCAWLSVEADTWNEVIGGSCELKGFYIPGMAI